MSTNNLYYLIKIGNHDNIMDLMNKGIVYMNPIKHFRDTEQNEQKKDKHEGTSRIEQLTYLKIIGEGYDLEISRKKPKSNMINGQYRQVDPNLKGNIYSMLAITPDLYYKTDSLDRKNMKFGDSFLIIEKPREFIDRIASEISNLKVNCEGRLVQYYNENTYNGDLGVFNKPLFFEHQSEYRIFVESDNPEPLILEIGSIEDISKMFPIEHFPTIKWEVIRDSG